MIRADQLCDAVLSAINTSTPVLPSGTSLDASVVDVVTIDPDKMPGNKLYLWVYWDKYEPGAPVSRAADSATTDITVMVAQKYTGSETRVPLSWRRERSEWFDSAVVAKFSDARIRIAGAYTDQNSAVEFDSEWLVKKVWIQSYTFTLRDD